MIDSKEVKKVEFDIYVCPNGHKKFIEQNRKFDICNICGCMDAKYIGKESLPKVLTKEDKFNGFIK